MAASLKLSSWPEDHEKPFPVFRQPTILGHFSLNGERQFLPDNSGLQYIISDVLRPEGKRVSLDLNKGVRKAIRSLPHKDQEKLDHLLRGVLLYRDRFRVDGELKNLHTNFICFRGLLTTLLCTPYERRDGWELHVSKWKGTLYLLQVDTPQRKRAKADETDRQRVMSSWGYKFEQFMSSSEPGRNPNTDLPVNENEEFCCLFRTRIGGLSLVYGAEMDAYQASQKLTKDQRLDPEKFIEMKTSREFDNQRQERNFRRFKQLKWWAQSFLVGTRQILCGWRDDQGLVERLEVFNVKDIPKSAVEWKANVCANFLSSFLQLLLTQVTTDDLSTIHRVTWDPRDGLWLNQLTIDPRDHFLPSWYTQAVFS